MLKRAAFNRVSKYPRFKNTNLYTIKTLILILFVQLNSIAADSNKAKTESSGTNCTSHLAGNPSVPPKEQIEFETFPNSEGTTPAGNHEFFKKPSGTLFLNVEGLGQMAIIENSDATGINRIIEASGINEGTPRTVFTFHAHVYAADGSRSLHPSGEVKPVIESAITEEHNRFYNQIKSQNPEAKGVILELLYTHPKYDTIDSEESWTLYPLNDIDFEYAKDVSKESKNYFFLTLVSPNGYRYSVAFLKGQNVSMEVFK